MMTIMAALDLTSEDTKTLDDLCQRWSSAMHTVFNRLIEEPEINLHRELMQKFNLNYRYVHTAIVEAQALIESNEELETNPQKVIFGSRKLFNKLKKRHQNGNKYQKIKERYQETRKYNLYSIG